MSARIRGGLITRSPASRLPPSDLGPYAHIVPQVGLITMKERQCHRQSQLDGFEITYISGLISKICEPFACPSKIFRTPVPFQEQFLL